MQSDFYARIEDELNQACDLVQRAMLLLAEAVKTTDAVMQRTRVLVGNGDPVMLDKYEVASVMTGRLTGAITTLDLSDVLGEAEVDVEVTDVEPDPEVEPS